MPVLPPTFLLQDYAQTWNPVAIVSTAEERRQIDRDRAAERRAEFLRYSRQVVEGLPRLVKDIQEQGILEDNLAALRRSLTEEVLRQQSTLEWADRERAAATISLQDTRKMKVHPSGKRQVKDLIRDQELLINEIATMHEGVSIVRDGYIEALRALESAEPKRLSAEEYATVRAIDQVMPALIKAREDFAALAAGKPATAQSRHASVPARLIGPTLGATLVFSIFFPGLAGVMIGAAIGLTVAIARNLQVTRAASPQ